MNTLFGTCLRSLKTRGMQVLILITSYLLLAHYLPTDIHRALYTISCLIKEVLVWILPLTVCFFIAHTISSFQKRALLFIVAIVMFEAFSNFCSVWYSYVCGHIATNALPPLQIPPSETDFQALWHLPLTRPTWWSSDKGSVAGLILGMVSLFARKSFIPSLIEQGKNCAQYILTRFFSPLIPIFVIGFVARMVQTQLLINVVAHCSFLLLWLVLFLTLYISILFFLGSDYSFRDFIRNIRNMLPAGGIAFSSGCSLSTMPWTISGTAKNLRNPQLAEAVIPATTNIQQIGDCITNTFLCFLIYTHFHNTTPDLVTWLSFTFIFVLARFATAAVLGGAIFIMLPVYETYLSFNSEMIALILAFNVILDPLITSCNVLGNGALCRLFEKVWDALVVSKNQAEEATETV